MHSFRINPRPLMTAFLVEELHAFRDEPVVILDVGARFGVDAEWSVFGDQLQVYAFEADEAEAARLAALSPRQLRYIPRAVGGVSGTATLYETDSAASSGLYKTRMDYFGRLLNRDNGKVVGEREIAVSTLDESLAAQGVASLDFIKLDIEGAELDVLRGGQSFLNPTNALGLWTEFRFHEEINGSPPFAEMDQFVREKGLRVFDLQFHHQSRAALPYPPAGSYRKPSGERYHAYTTSGQLQDGDALYFRDLLLPSAALTLRKASAVRVLKLCAFMEIFSFNDCAAELIIACKDRFDRRIDSTKLLDLLASGIVGQATTYQAYMEQYFRPDDPAIEPLERKPPSESRRPSFLQRWASRGR